MNWSKNLYGATCRCLVFGLLAVAPLACETKPVQPAEPDAGSSIERGEEAGAESGLESDVGGAADVEPMEFDDKMFPGELPVGDQRGGFSFRDSVGENHVAFSVEETESKGGKVATVLHVKHVVKAGEGGEVREVGAYREVVEDCEFDVVLMPKYGDWSVSDLDGDGVGEATFAYTADCTSDVSPNKHEVLVTEGGEKFALRGVTSEEVAPGEVVGGEFDADDMTDEFREHADMVWQETSVGTRMR